VASPCEWAGLWNFARARKVLPRSRALRALGEGRFLTTPNLSGDQFRPRLAARPAGFLQEFTFGARPIVERVSGCAAALQVNLIGAQGNLLGCRARRCCLRLSRAWHGSVARLWHPILLSRAGHHFTLGAKQSVGKFQESQSKDSIVRIEETPLRCELKES
jgi:hypothetical protein